MVSQRRIYKGLLRNPIYDSRTPNPVSELSKHTGDASYEIINSRKLCTSYFWFTYQKAWTKSGPDYFEEKNFSIFLIILLTKISLFSIKEPGKHLPGSRNVKWCLYTFLSCKYYLLLLLVRKYSRILFYWVNYFHFESFWKFHCV